MRQFKACFEVHHDPRVSDPLAASLLEVSDLRASDHHAQADLLV